MNVLIINAGSSSLKYQLMNPETGDVSAKGHFSLYLRRRFRRSYK